MSRIEPIAGLWPGDLPRFGGLSASLAALQSRIDGFLFRPASATDLGVCRALFFLGVLIFYAPADLSNWAFVPRVYWRAVWLFRVLHLSLLTPIHLKILVWCWLLSLACASLGAVTRISTFVAFTLGLYVLGLPHNFGKVGHGEPVLIFTMLILAISRCGDAFSIDAGLRRPRGQCSGEYTWPIRAVWVLMSIVFFSAGATKLIRSGLGWITSDNLQILLLAHHAALKTPLSLLGWRLAQHPQLCRVVAGCSVGLELTFPLALLSRRLRTVLIPAVIVMQIGIGIAMGVYFTQFLLCYLFWVPWSRMIRILPVTTARSRQ